MHTLHLYNSFSKKKETFQPIHPPYVNMYVCGPTVYGPAHLGHARSAITFDILFRHLQHSKYQVKYIRNITDVGHLENETEEDKIAQAAKKYSQEPMALAQHFTNSYRKDMQDLNILPPTIEPQASGHITEQIAIVQNIIKKGYGYVKNGSVYFDLQKYHQNFHYGTLSGRILEDLWEATRSLNHQKEKKNAHDFALWKKASEKHIMRWPSPWSEGYPGWHLECTAMSKKYFGSHFDIHGGGMDLLFPHHECEIAQAMCTEQQNPAKYWIHHNMITVKKQKMGKSLQNFITIQDLLQQHTLHPMAIRMFILQAHYRNPLNFSLPALQAAQKAYYKLYNGYQYLQANQVTTPTYNSNSYTQTLKKKIKNIEEKCTYAINDDLNTPKVIACLFDLLKIIHDLQKRMIDWQSLDQDTRICLYNTYTHFFKKILGLYEEEYKEKNTQYMMSILLPCYIEAKKNNNYDLIDHIRKALQKQNIRLKDLKNTVDWHYVMLNDKI